MSPNIEESIPDNPSRLHCPILVSERLILREPNIEDMDAITKLANNRNISATLREMPHPYTRKHAANFILRSTAGEFGYCVYAVTLMETGEFIGICRLQERDEDEGVELSYWIGQSYWNKGYASEAINALIDGAFRSSNIDALYVAPFSDNIASHKIIKKMGFQYLKTNKRHSMVSGTKDTDHFVLKREDWLDIRSLCA